MKKEKRSPKVLHVATVPEFLFFLDKQLGYMNNNGFEVHVMSSPGEDFDTFIKTEGVIPHEVSIEREISLLRDIRSLWNIWKVLRREKFDIVHAHTPKAGLLGMVAALLSGVKVRIYHMHGLTYTTRKGWKRKLLYYSEKLSCFLSYKTYAVSPSLKRFVVEEKIIPDHKIGLIKNGSINGLDVQHRFNRTLYPESKVQNIHGIRKEDYVLGFVGRIVREKGVIELFDLYNHLKQDYPNVKLLIVGKMEKKEELPNELLHQLYNDKSITYVGSVDNPAPYYSLMDVLVLPTYREGFGLVAIEAMAMGVPVIASAVLGCVDTVENGKNGFLVPVKDVEQMVEKVEYYMENKEDRKRHGDYGRESVKQKYEQTSIWRDQIKDYRNFLERI